MLRRGHDVSVVGPYELCEWVQASILGELERCESDPVTTTYPGVGLVAWDDCCGQLVVSPERIFRSVQFPTEDTTDEKCYAGIIAVDLLASLVRCVPVPNDRGMPPSASELASAHKRLLDDAAIVWQAVTGDLDSEWERSGVAQTFSGGQGGCVAIETRLTIGVDSSTWCYDCG
jgi:hypothetical protein